MNRRRSCHRPRFRFLYDPRRSGNPWFFELQDVDALSGEALRSFGLEWLRERCKIHFEMGFMDMIEPWPSRPVYPHVLMEIVYEPVRPTEEADNWKSTVLHIIPEAESDFERFLDTLYDAAQFATSEGDRRRRHHPAIACPR